MSCNYEDIPHIAQSGGNRLHPIISIKDGEPCLCERDLVDADSCIVRESSGNMFNEPAGGMPGALSTTELLDVLDVPKTRSRIPRVVRRVRARMR